MASEDFQVDDLVWAKMKGFPPWPAKIAEPQPGAKPPKNKNANFVYFFGTKNYAWILKENITPHSESFLSNVSKNKSSTYKKAIDDLLNFSSSSPKDKRISKNVKASFSEKEEIENPKIVKDSAKKALISDSRKEKEFSHRKSESYAKKSQTKVVKIIKTSKKQEKKVLTGNEAIKKIVRKRPLGNEQSRYISPKIQKVIVNKDPHVGSYLSDFIDSDTTCISTRYDDDDDDASLSDLCTTNEMRHKSDGKKKKATTKKIGFIGLGNVGTNVVLNLLKSGHDVTVWNRTTFKCDKLIKLGAKKASSAAELILNCDITFCSVSDSEASKAIIFGDRGILKGLDYATKYGYPKKGYVEMTSIDPETSNEIEEVILRKGGLYLEAPMCGNGINADEKSLLILASGNKDLFIDCNTCFEAMGKCAYFISCNVGIGSQFNLLYSMFSGTIYAAAAEALVLAKRLNIPESDFLTILSQGPLQSENLLEKIRKMQMRDFKTVTPLKHTQKDLNLTLSLGNLFSLSMPVTAATNEVYKRARRMDYSNYDVSAVYEGAYYFEEKKKNKEK